jgi:tetratricopeptide (TPR) repeat protein
MVGNQSTYQNMMEQGHSAAWDQNWEEAASCYRLALKDSPDNPAALTNLGLALYELQKFSEALKYYQAAARVAPNDPIPPEKMARIFERQGRLVDAAQGFCQAAEKYLLQKEAEKAIESWTRAIGLQPDHLMARTRLAMVFGWAANLKP